MLTRTHQAQLHLVLHILDMEGATHRLASQQRAHHTLGQTGHHLANTRRRCALATFNGEESLGQRNGNLRGFETNDRTVSANDAVLRIGGFGIGGCFAGSGMQNRCDT